jgi:hypothetical protein
MAEVDEEMDYFTLFNFSAKWDPVPTMLTQNHVSSIKGFYGQTTAFRKETIKSNVVIMAQTPGRNEAKVHPRQSRRRLFYVLWRT